MSRCATPSCAGLHDRPFNDFGVCPGCCTGRPYDDIDLPVVGLYDRDGERPADADDPDRSHADSRP